MNAPEKCPKCNMGGITDEGQPSSRWHYGCGTYVYCDKDGLEVAYVGDLCDARMEIAEIKKERDEAREALTLATSEIVEQTFELRQKLGKAREALQKVASLAHGNADKTVCLINLNAIQRIVSSALKKEITQ